MGERPSEDAPGCLTGVAVDSRCVEPGDLFVAARGARADGHDFLAEAFGRGARAALVRNDWRRFVPSGAAPGPLIVLGEGQDTVEALGKLGQCHLHDIRPNGKPLPVVAITGSVGKTSTKEITASVLGIRFKTLKSEGNLNTEFGLPMTMLRAEPDTEAAVFEMGMRGLGEIAALCRLASPVVGVVTAVAPVHLERLGTMENIAKAKAELLASLPPHGTAVVNADDPWCRAMTGMTRARIISYGLNPSGDPAFTAADWRPEGEGGQSFTLITPNGSVRVHLPLLGRHQTGNALAAAAVGAALGLRLEEIARGLESVPPDLARTRITKPGGVTLVDDSYNASPITVEASLKMLADLGGGRRVAVVGDMYELGAMCEEGHRQVGRAAVSVGIDLLVTVGDLAAIAAAAAQEAGLSEDRILVFKDKALAVEALRKLLEPGDIVLIKGSRGMRMEEITAALQRHPPGKE